jgi:hypothetical protein
LYEYTAGAGYEGEANQLIYNLKKKRGAGGYQYKAGAIERCAVDMGPALNPKWMEEAVLVPTPPSKIKTDPAYDDRITRICNAIKSTAKVDVRELVVQTQSTDAVHEGERLPPWSAPLHVLRSSGTSPNFLMTFASPKLPVAGSPVRLNATAPTCPGLRDRASARMTTATGLRHSVGSPAATPSSAATKGSATK